jgi:hypothetical protein
MTIEDDGRDDGDGAVPTTHAYVGDATNDQDTPAADQRAAMSYRSWVTILAGVILLPLMVVSSLTIPAVVLTKADAAASARVVDAAALEAATGIRVNLVAVTAEGGLVDLRFTVIDEDKASHLMHDAATMPSLYVERSGRVLSASHPLAHKVSVLDGATYFLFYANSGGAIQGGTPVSVVVDGLRTAPLIAQS